MKFGKIFIFAVILLVGVTQIYPQRVLGPDAKWDPAVIVLSHNVIVEGTDIEISATIKVLKNVRGLRYEAGVGTQILSQQPWNNQLNAGVTIPIKFTWKAVRGRHNIFFRLIPPHPSRSNPIQKLDKTINVVPRMQDPTQDPNLSVGNNIPRSPPCVENPSNILDVSFDLTNHQYNRANRNLNYSYSLQNNTSYCIKKFKVILFIKPHRLPFQQIDTYFVEADLLGGWVLKGHEKKFFLGNYTLLEDQFTSRGIFIHDCPNNPNHKCISFRIRIQTDGGENFKIDIGEVEE